MSNDNAKHVMLVPLNPSDPTSTAWRVSVGTAHTDAPPYPKVHLDKDTGPYLIHFQIQGPTNSQIRFSGNPIVGKPSTSPLNAQITAKVVSSDGKDLFILDKNSNDPAQPLQIPYQLNFAGYGPVDPIIENGGSTITYPAPSTNFLSDFSSTQVALLVIAVFVIGAALSAAIVKMFRNG